MVQKGVCWFYNQKSGCKKKGKCEFLHIKHQPRKKKSCWYFIRGICLFKEKCWNSHKSQRPQYIREKIVVESNKQKKERLQLKHEVQKVKGELRRVKKILSTLLNKERSNLEENENKLLEDDKVNKGFEQAINNIKGIKVQQTNDGKKEEECLKMGQKKENPVKEISAENDAKEFSKIGRATDKTLEETPVDQKDGYEIYIDFITKGFWEKRAKDIDEGSGKIHDIPISEVKKAFEKNYWLSFKKNYGAKLNENDKNGEMIWDDWGDL